MKKFLVFAIFAVLPLLVWSAGTLDVSLGFTMPGDHNISVDTPGGTYDYDYDVTGNVCFFGEYVTDLKWVDGLIGGAGVHYLVPHEVDMDDVGSDPTFSFVPVYGLCGYKYPLSEKTKVRGLINIGYDFMDANSDYKDGADLDLDGGLFWGLGAGFEFNERLFLDFMFNNYSGGTEVSYDDEDRTTITTDITQSAFLIRFGVKIPKDWSF